MRLRVKFHLFDTSHGSLISEGERFEIIQIDDEVDLDKHENIKLVSSEIGKEINRSASDIKVLGYELL